MIGTVQLVMLVVLSSFVLSLGTSDETLTLVVSHPTPIGAAPETPSSSIDSFSASALEASTLLGNCSQDCDAGDVQDAIDDLWLACVFGLLTMLPLVCNLLWGLREQAKLEALCYQLLERPG